MPADWTDSSVVTLAGRDAKTFAPNIVVTRAMSDAALADYAKSQLPDIKAATKKHKLVSENEERIAGQDAYVLEHSFQTPERTKVRQLQYFVRSGADVVVLSLTCAESELRGRAEMMKRVAASFVVEATER